MDGRCSGDPAEPGGNGSWPKLWSFSRTQKLLTWTAASYRMGAVITPTAFGWLLLQPPPVCRGWGFPCPGESSEQHNLPTNIVRSRFRRHIRSWSRFDVFGVLGCVNRGMRLQGASWAVLGWFAECFVRTSADDGISSAFNGSRCGAVHAPHAPCESDTKLHGYYSARPEQSAPGFFWSWPAVIVV